MVRLPRFPVGTGKDSSLIRRALQMLSGRILPIIQAHLHSHVYNELCSIQPDGVETQFPTADEFEPGTLTVVYGGVVFDELKWKEDADCCGVTFDGALLRNPRVKLRMSYELAE